MPQRKPLDNTAVLEFFLNQAQIRTIQQAIQEGRKVETEETSFTDPGQDETRILVDGNVIAIIPGY